MTRPMTRLAHACAALAAALLLIVGPGVPAAAEPQPQSTLCTVQEWQNPRNFADCAKRLAAAGAQRAQCIKAPTPVSPDAGIAGWLTSRPDADLRSGVVGRYTRYGVGGYQLDLYDVSCAGGIAHPEANFENSIASIEFAVAAAVIGGANTLREHAYEPGSMWAWSDDMVRSATQKAYDYVFSIFGALTLAGAGVWLIWRARAGRLSEALRIAGWALLVMVLATAVAKWPLSVAHGFDRAATTGLGAMHSVLGPGPDDVPADQCPFVDMDPEACKDHRTVAVRASDEATEAILYKSWLRAMLGSADSEVATKYGPALYDATTFTWSEAADMKAHPELRQQYVDRKAQQWLAVAEQIKTEDPEAYENLQGLRGTDRVGAGLVALLSALVFAGFDTAASFMILLGFLIARVVVVVFPILATWGILQPASSGIRRLANSTITALINIVLFGAAAGLYLTAVGLVFDSSMPGAAQIIVVLLAGVACWLVLRPARALAKARTVPPVDGGSDDGRQNGRLRDLFAFAARTVVQAGAARGPVRAEATVGEPRRPARPETRALPGGRR
ncbi:MFS transporter [Dactylosporangium sucinum]|uniref:MFS transporter n=1 Tax=Dactylosporangium sucinum TaxID=1424081 RepID=A0A917U3U3_9ACTN|nr:MFS transporter [Dactylosporangium sucinum]GGM52984.1 hypothetical protein GCM10007977_063260 [Dactylosporangium sucinum]